MKNKYLKYLLIAAVACVWGTILFRIVNAMGDKRPPVISRNELPATISTEQGNRHYILVAQYADPFLKDVALPVELMAQPLAAAVVAPPPPPVDVSFVQYMGMISNVNQPKNKVGLVSVQGKEEMVKEGDVVAEVKIKKILPSEVKVVYKGKEFVVKKG